jgi:hypothetical protein
MGNLFGWPIKEYNVASKHDPAELAGFKELMFLILGLSLQKMFAIVFVVLTVSFGQTDQ